MRRALGLIGATASQPAQQRPEQARARHRFVQDGEVPVEIVTGPRSPDAAPNGRTAAVQAALEGERAARADAERSLAEARTTVRSLQAKLAHAELAHGEALAAERRARERAEAALRDLTAAREPAGREPVETEATRAAETPASRAAVERAASGTGGSKPKAPAAKAREPKPVKWWLPGYKAAIKAR